MDLSTHVGAQHFIQLMKLRNYELSGKKGLVVGFGEGHEANYLVRNIKSEIFGIDVLSRIPAQEPAKFHPVLASALELPYDIESFDFVFYHHVIEHVINPGVTLAEIYRVLRPGGILYIGTPNRNRILGYLGAYNISKRRIIRNNLKDYEYRLRGKFRNELGAHAGFSRKELGGLLASNFTNIDWVTANYLYYKYGQRLPALIMNTILRPTLMEFLAPSIYAVCIK